MNDSRTSEHRPGSGPHAIKGCLCVLCNLRRKEGRPERDDITPHTDSPACQPTSKTLVQRLRLRQGDKGIGPLYSEAADEIERLREFLADLENDDGSIPAFMWERRNALLGVIAPTVGAADETAAALPERHDAGCFYYSDSCFKHSKDALPYAPTDTPAVLACEVYENPRPGAKGGACANCGRPPMEHRRNKCTHPGCDLPMWTRHHTHVGSPDKTSAP